MVSLSYADIICLSDKVVLPTGDTDAAAKPAANASILWIVINNLIQE